MCVQVISFLHSSYCRIWYTCILMDEERLWARFEDYALYFERSMTLCNIFKVWFSYWLAFIGTSCPWMVIWYIRWNFRLFVISLGLLRSERLRSLFYWKYTYGLSTHFMKITLVWVKNSDTWDNFCFYLVWIIE